MSDTPTVVVVRHPDFGNEYHVFGDVSTFDIDMGSEFDGAPESYPDALEWASELYAASRGLCPEAADLVEQIACGTLAGTPRFEARFDSSVVISRGSARSWRVMDTATGGWAGGRYYRSAHEASSDIIALEDERDILAEIIAENDRLASA